MKHTIPALLTALALVLAASQARSEDDEAATSWKRWVTRQPGVDDATAAWVGLQRVAEKGADAASWIRAARAAYWLGTQLADAGASSSEQMRVFDAGQRAAERARTLDARDAGGYYWDAVNRAKLAELRGIVQSAWQLPTLISLTRKAEELSPGYAYGGVYRYWGAVIARVPTFLLKLKGGSLEEGDGFFRKSVELAPDFALTRVFWSELKRRMGDDAAALRLLHEAADAPISPSDEVEAWNRHARLLAAKQLQRR